MTDSARRQPPINTTLAVPSAVFDAVCEALARTDLTMLKRLISNLRIAIIDYDDFTLSVPAIDVDPDFRTILQGDIAEILAALRELVEQEHAWPVMPT